MADLPPVHPIDFRYGREHMRTVFTPDRRLRALLDVEVALVRAHAEVGTIPKKDAEAIAIAAGKVTVKRVEEIERETRHDVVALVRALSESAGDAGRWVHLGATSSDILDTATALQLTEACDIIGDDLARLESVLLERTRRNRDLVCVGRTHGQHAVPTTYGLRFAVWACEVRRHRERLEQCRKRVLVGQMTGAVGTQAALGPEARRVQELMMERLGLEPVLVSTQVVQRDRYAEFFLLCALVAATLDKVCVAIRTLQRTEIGEVAEPTGDRQVGSSAMPQKRNPIHAERVCGLARVVRGLCCSSLENVPLWDERDLTNSSPERVIIPECCVLLDYILDLTTGVLAGLTIDKKAVKRNLALTGGRNMAEAVMTALVGKGMDRQEAHELVRMAAKDAGDFADAVVERAGGAISKDEVKAALRPESFIGTAGEQVDRVLEVLGEDL